MKMGPPPLQPHLRPRCLSRVLLACCICCSASAATACSPQETPDQSQRLLPFPEQQPATPDVHVELLRRLREALQQTPPVPKLQDTPTNDGKAATEPPEPEPIAPQELLDLSRSLQNLVDRIPPGLVPRGLAEMPPEQLEKSLQHPDTQQSLRRLLEQFRRDGLLPPQSENGTPIPGPPPQSPQTTQPDSSEPAEPQPGTNTTPELRPDRSPKPDSTPRSGIQPRPAPQPRTIPVSY
ncbi:MAG: hypothetical protein RLZZ436_3264, partial [Planctomycetota bacterium]